MPKRTAPLTDVQIRNIKPRQKEVKLFDGGGLFLLVAPSGGKLWRLKYRFDGKGKKQAFGVYPEVSLVDARQKREKARELIAQGIDPGEARKEQDAATLRKQADCNGFWGGSLPRKKVLRRLG